MKDKKTVSLCAKWCPSIKGSHNSKLLICESIGRSLFEQSEDKVSNYQHGINVQTKLRKQYLTPLRTHSRVTETFVSLKTFGKINYNHVPAQAMKKHKSTFEKFDQKRYQAYLDSVVKGEAKVNVGPTQAYELCRDCQIEDKQV
eukprot:UN28211